jgi:hypothetical protein
MASYKVDESVLTDDEYWTDNLMKHDLNHKI